MAPPTFYCAADYAAAGVAPQDLSSYRSDSLWNYELGAKSRLADHRVTLNGAIYQINWHNLQQTQQFSCGYDFTVNAGAARSRGGELELSAAPFKGLTIAGGLGFEDAVITSAGATVRTYPGEPVQQIAPWTASLSGDYSFPLAGAVEGFVRADGSYTDRSFSANNSVTNLRLRKAYDLVNLRAGVRTAGWDFAAFVANVGNTHADLGDNQSEGGQLPGRPRILVNPPRTFGAEVTVRF
jgi:outer membrane receptor protein involved in Fe transport